MGVDTHSFMFTRCGALGALINVLITVIALEPRWTGAGPLSCHFVGVTASSRLAWVDVALVVQMAKKSSLARWTLTLILANLVNACSTVVARLGGTVIFVHLAVCTSVPIDTDAFISSLRVSAGAMVLTWVVEGTLVHIVQTIVSGPVVSALTRVGVDTVNARASVMTNTVDTVVNVHLTVGSSES